MILEAIDRHIIQPKAYGQARGRTSHYPSSASCKLPDGSTVGACLRAEYWNYKGEEPSNPLEANGAWAMTLGKLIEVQVMSWLSEMGILLGKNVKFYDADMKVSGEVDGFIWDFTVDDKGYPNINQPRKVIGLEVKSAYGYAFRSAIQHKPKLEHLMQTMIYLKNFPKVDVFEIVYVARDNPVEGRKSFRITLKEGYAYVNNYQVSEVSIQGIERRWKELEIYLQNNQLPPRDYQLYYSEEQIKAKAEKGELSNTKVSDYEKGKSIPSDWQCLYCSFKNKCWGEEALNEYDKRTKEKSAEYISCKRKAK